MMASAQAVKETTQITEQMSLQLTRNLLRIAIFNISYIRGLFPEKYFDDKYVPALEMKIKKLMPRDPESRRLVDWMEKGVYDALEKRYLKTLTFALCEALGGALLEEYTFSFTYGSDSEEVSMDITRDGDTKKSKTFKTSASDVTPSQMKSSACKMVRTLVQLMRTLDGVPEERTIVMKLLYYDETTPSDYEPPYFRGCTPEDDLTWTRTPLKMKVGDVNSKHYMIALKVRSVLDPCDGDDVKVDETHGSETAGEYDDSSSESEDEQETMITSQDKKGPASSSEREFPNPGERDQDEDMCGSDVEESQPAKESEEHQEKSQTQSDEETEDEEDVAKVHLDLKTWVLSRKTDNIDVSDAMADFPDVSVELIEDLMGRLVRENVLRRLGEDLYCLTTKMRLMQGVKQDTLPQKVCATVKDSPIDNRLNQERSEQTFANKDNDEKVFTTALYHTLQLEYVTATALQKKLGREVNAVTIKKLLEKMVEEGYVERMPSNKRLGRRVLRTAQVESKLKEISAAMSSCALQLDGAAPKAKSTQLTENSPPLPAGSTIGQQASLGSDVTRHQSSKQAVAGKPPLAGFKAPSPLKKPTSSSGKEDSYGSLRKDATPAGSCTSPGRNMSVASHRELIAQRYQESQDSECNQKVRKASMVVDPICQTAKRVRSGA